MKENTLKNDTAPFYFKNLDGLRAIAAFAVIFFHITLWFDYPKSNFYNLLKFVFGFGGDGGGLGVTFFFILSGFLITYLMFAEQTKNGSLNVRFFYARRILRIWPLYYATLIVGFLIYPFIVNLLGHPHTEKASAFLYSIFAANFDHIYRGNPSSGILGVQWSVGIEEQFYLLWPILFYIFSKTKIFPVLLMFIIVISELFYFYKAEHWEVSYYHLISNFRLLSYGGLLGYIVYFKGESVVNIFRKMNKTTHFLIYLTCITLMLFQQKISEIIPFHTYTYHYLQYLFFGFVIIEQNYSPNSFFKISSFKTLTWLGKISYGLYLVHMIAVYIVIGIFPSNENYVLLKILVTTVLTVSISYLSYTYFESWFLNLKNKFSNQLISEKKHKN